jgi:hypothetical protein
VSEKVVLNSVELDATNENSCDVIAVLFGRGWARRITGLEARPTKGVGQRKIREEVDRVVPFV